MTEIEACQLFANFLEGRDEDAFRSALLSTAEYSSKYQCLQGPEEIVDGMQGRKKPDTPSRWVNKVGIFHGAQGPRPCVYCEHLETGRIEAIYSVTLQDGGIRGIGLYIVPLWGPPAYREGDDIYLPDIKPATKADVLRENPGPLRDLRLSLAELLGVK